MATKYFTAAETAKLIRTALKEAFPAIKFTVRSSSYSGGASVRIGWTDGPTAAQVESVIAPFEGAYFDGSIDYKGSVFAMMDGQRVKFGADFIFCERSYSDRMVAGVLARVTARLGGMDQPTVEDYRQGRLYGWKQSGGCEVQREVNVAMSRHTYTITGKSPTAARVFVTHDDGYSRQCGSGHSRVNPD